MLPTGFGHPHASEEARAIAEARVAQLRDSQAIADQPDRRWVDDWLHRSYLNFWNRDY